MSLRILTERESLAPDLAALVLPAEGPHAEPAAAVFEAFTEVEDGLCAAVEADMRACTLDVRPHRLGYFQAGLMPGGVFVRDVNDSMGAALDIDAMNARFVARHRTRSKSILHELAANLRRLRRAIDAVPAGDERDVAEVLIEKLVALAVRVGIDDDQRTAPRLLGGVFPRMFVGEREEQAAPVPVAPEPEAVVEAPAVAAPSPSPEPALETRTEHAAFDGMPFDGGIYS